MLPAGQTGPALILSVLRLMAYEHPSLTALAARLGYTETHGLLLAGQPTPSGTRAELLKRAREHVKVDAVYFAGDRPLAYFAERPSLDRETCWKLHRAAWNDSRVPLLFVVTRDQVAIYDSYAEPAHDAEHVNDEQRLVQVLDLLSTELEAFSRPEVESGRLWQRWPDRFDLKHRCDQTLLENLRGTQDQLHAQGLPHPVIYRLLPRVILILYLDHRRVLTPSYYQQFGGGDLFSVLRHKRTAYDLFAALHEHFNGDLFPLSAEEISTVKDEHVATIAECLSGTEMATGQRSLWPLYDFSIIPIQLVSAIYEFFLRDRRRPDSPAVGTVYTPQELVELLMNEVLPWPGSRAGSALHPDGRLPRVIDPACGSGIFLVEAYRRIVEHWRARHPDQRLGAKELRTLLTTCIHGIEKEPSARHVTAFSLYLAMLDYLEPKHIWTQVKFPTLTLPREGGPANLRLGDAFENGEKGAFDLVVGNPPWKRNHLPESARRYCAGNGQPVANEIAHAFLWRFLDLTHPEGRAALLAPAKWLFNREGPDRKFRRAFLERAYVESIVNLSAVRKTVFVGAIGPTTAVVFRPVRPERVSETLLYCTPKKHRAQVLPLFIDASDVKWISRKDAEARDDVWKTLMWASWRDLLLIRRLSEPESTVEDFLEESGCVIGRGFQPYDEERNKPQQPQIIDDEELGAMPHLEAKHVTRYAVDPRAIQARFPGSRFLRTGPRAIYEKPHVLLKEGVPGGTLAAAYVSGRCTFRDTITGIHGPDPEVLKALTAYVNTTLAAYYVFLTSTTWGIERERAKRGEILCLPAAPLADPEVRQTLAGLFDVWVGDEGGRQEVEREIERVVGDAFELSDLDRVLVEDLTTFVLADRAADSRSATRADLERYVEAYAEILRTLFDGTRGLAAVVRPTDGPLTVISLRLQRRGGVEVKRADGDDLHSVLLRLDEQLTTRESPSIYLRRHIRYYDGETLHIVKPNERKHWTRSAAFADADETIAQAVARRTLVAH